MAKIAVFMLLYLNYCDGILILIRWAIPIISVYCPFGAAQHSNERA